MANSDPERESFLEAVEDAIEADRQNAGKWSPLYGWFEDRFGIKGGRFGDVGAKLLTEDKQLSNRIRKELAELNPRYIVLTALSGVSIDKTKEMLDEAHLPRAQATLILGGLQPIELQIYEEDNVTEELEKVFPELTAVRLKRHDVAEKPAKALTVPTLLPSSIAVLVDDKVHRMVKLAIASNKAVILVGAPGTGKTTLLGEIIQEIIADPESLGFTEPIHEPRWATPEEGWSHRELVGGETVDEQGRLRFRLGHILEAIRDDRWLVLDETNRADMDKIFGGVLTWLSGQAVQLGRASTDLNAPRVELDWNDGPTSEVFDLEQLMADTPSGDSIRFMTGSQWRLLGTYNALDAQRVFRFGEALGRRFARVPIPCPTEEEIAPAFETVAGGLPDPLPDAIMNLYGAHLERPETMLGPALFLRIPEYVHAGIASGIGDSKEVYQLLAEAYLVNVGTWLARLEPEELEDLRTRVVEDRKALAQQDWEWLTQLLPALGLPK